MKNKRKEEEEKKAMLKVLEQKNLRDDLDNLIDKKVKVKLKGGFDFAGRLDVSDLNKGIAQPVYRLGEVEFETKEYVVTSDNGYKTIFKDFQVEKISAFGGKDE